MDTLRNIRNNPSIALFLRIWFKLAALTLGVGTLLRIVLLFNPQTVDTGFSLGGWMQIFLLGALNDLCVITIAYIFVWLFMLLATEAKYRRPAGYIIFGHLVGLFCYTTFAHNILHEYGSVAPLAGSILTALLAAVFGVKLFFKRVRRPMTLFGFGLLLSIYVCVIVFNVISEYIFWDEFGVRYNFIAVDYLIYTNEVIGNIMESYPIIPLVGIMLAITAAVTWALFRRDIPRTDLMGEGWRWKAVISPVYLVAAAAAFGLLVFNTRWQQTPNVYLNELQANGVYRFFDAFFKNRIDYRQFYPTLDDDQARRRIFDEYGSSEGNMRRIASKGSEQRPNIVLITLESMSASFMERYGNGNGLTPALDSLSRRAIVFDNMFATGNRTVRGLEAVTLSLPPCPGQSVIKREQHADMNSTGRMLKQQKGYSVTYFYGGMSYFDNMKSFFGSNHYDIIDKESYSPDEITFANIWGVCDEDAYDKVLKTLSEKAAADSRPFFAHVMSVSNHRPYTYPDGRISIPPTEKIREGGVMYSDYALGRFLEKASREEWFDNTVFVITADHCASSAGKIEIPLEKYRIPAMIYSPSRFAPQAVAKVASQIDIMPTLFALLDMEYDSAFYGRDILDEEYPERAFIATYQDLGYLKNDTLTIMSPRSSSARRSLTDGVKQYAVEKISDSEYDMQPVGRIDEDAVREAAAYYQTSYLWN